MPFYSDNTGDNLSFTAVIVLIAVMFIVFITNVRGCYISDNKMSAISKCIEKNISPEICGKIFN